MDNIFETQNLIIFSEQKLDLKKKISNTTIHLTKGDISDMKIEAFVFYAQSDLKLGAGFGNAVAMRGGLSIQKELAAIGSLELTKAVVTKAGKLKAEYIVHANGPKFQEEDLENKFRATIKNTLLAAEEKGIKQLAFPPMGTGFYLIPLNTSANLMIEVFKEYFAQDSKFEEILIVIMDNREWKPFEEAMSKI